MRHRPLTLSEYVSQSGGGPDWSGDRLKRRPGFALIADHLSSNCGVRYRYKHFLDQCDRAGIPLLVIGDAPRLEVQYERIQYVQVRSPALCNVSRFPNGLKPQPFLALRTWETEDAHLKCLWTGAVGRLFSSLSGSLGAEDFYSLDALASKDEWLTALAEEIRDVLSLEPIRCVQIATQSFLGFAAVEAMKALPHLKCVCAFHTDYPSMYFDRLTHGALGGVRHLCRPVETAMLERLTRTFIPPSDVRLFSSAIAAGRFSRLGVDRSRPQIITPGGVDTSLFRPARRRRGVGRDEVKLLYVGRLEPEKNTDFLIKMDKHLNCAHWIIAGEGSERERLSASLPNVNTLGHLSQEELAEVYRTADVLVFPPSHDTFGLSVLEAMASGVPVVVAQGTAPASYLRHGETGLICPPAPKPFADAVMLLNGDPMFWREISQAGRREAFAFTWEKSLRPALELAYSYS